MNIKIKSSGVYCLVGEDYDRVYHALLNQFGDGELQLFTERIPGHEYLQWELPGDGWQSLADGDSLLGLEVKKELLQRQRAVCDRFGDNQYMAQRVLSVPDDNYVYYKTDSDGHLLIRLTAWGYSYPERIIGTSTTGILPEKVEKENVSIHLVYDEQPLPGKPVKLNGFLRATDAFGAIEIGELPVGYQFDVDVDAQHRHITVEKGEGYITLDLTEYTTLEVIVTKDELPFGAAKIAIDYKNRNIELVSDVNGYARAKFPMDLEHSFCNVTVEGESQQRPLDPGSTTFRFNFVTPPAPPVIETENVSIHLVYDGQTLPGKPVIVNGYAHTSDAFGVVEVGELPVGDQLYVNVDNLHRHIAVEKGRKHITLDLTEYTTLEVFVTKDAIPFVAAKIAVDYKSRHVELVSDANGYAHTIFPLDLNQGLCTVTVEGQSQQRTLDPARTTFRFNLGTPSVPPVIEEWKDGNLAWWWWVFLAILTIFTYWVSLHFFI